MLSRTAPALLLFLSLCALASGAEDQQRSWGARMDQVGVFVMSGEGFADRVRTQLPVFPVMLRITNGMERELELDRKLDEVILRLRDGTEIPRTDVWERGDLMERLARLPADLRAKFVYPRAVLPGASIDVVIVFDAQVEQDEPKDFWVRLSALPSLGVRLTPLETELSEDPTGSGPV